MPQQQPQHGQPQPQPQASRSQPQPPTSHQHAPPERAAAPAGASGAMPPAPAPTAASAADAQRQTAIKHELATRRPFAESDHGRDLSRDLAAFRTIMADEFIDVEQSEGGLLLTFKQLEGVNHYAVKITGALIEIVGLMPDGQEWHSRSVKLPRVVSDPSAIVPAQTEEAGNVLVWVPLTALSLAPGGNERSTVPVHKVDAPAPEASPVKPASTPTASSRTAPAAASESRQPEQPAHEPSDRKRLVSDLQAFAAHLSGRGISAKATENGLILTVRGLPMDSAELTIEVDGALLKIGGNTAKTRNGRTYLTRSSMLPRRVVQLSEVHALGRLGSDQFVIIFPCESFESEPKRVRGMIPFTYLDVASGGGANALNPVEPEGARTGL
jgi:hypothetical protein